MTAHPIDPEALRRLADQATPGPWEAGPVEWHDFDETQTAQSSVRTAERVAITWDDHGGDVFTPKDAEFIAAARTAVPALLDENAALRARIKSVEDVLEESEARGPVGMTFNGTPFPAWISIATIRRALTA